MIVTAWENKFLEHITASREVETVPIGKREYYLGFVLAYAVLFACEHFTQNRHAIV